MPRPKCPSRLVVKLRSKIRCHSSGSMPQPLSSTSTITQPGSGRPVRTVNLPGSLMASRLLAMRLVHTCCRAAGWQRTSGSGWYSLQSSCCLRRFSNISRVSSSPSCKSTSEGSSLSCRAYCLRLLTRSPMRRAHTSILRRKLPVCWNSSSCTSRASRSLAVRPANQRCQLSSSSRFICTASRAC